VAPASVFAGDVLVNRIAMAAPAHELSTINRLFNGMLGWLVSHGVGPGYMRELIVRGRKSGRAYSTPVNLIEHAGKLWLVAPRGRTQWTRNAEAAGEVVLKRGARRETYRIRTTAIDERPAVLKLYLDTYKVQVQRFMAVPAGAPVEAFAAVAKDHPVYELIRA
jgi:deazaflavin-dependent oxidoreductase (nitroreductase family)